MTFENYQYTRPNTDQLKEQVAALVERLNSANTAKETLEIFNEYNELRDNVSTMAQLSEIRVTIDTTDKFYEAEQEFWDEFGPELQNIRLNHFRIDRIAGADNDRHKTERVRVNNEPENQRDVYGSRIYK